MKIFIFLLFVISSIDLFGQIPPFKWVKKIPFEIVSQTTDSYDNIYITGSFSDTINFENITLISNNNSIDIVVAKFDSSGSLIWYKLIGGSTDDYTADIKLDNNNDLILTAGFHSSIIIEGDTITATPFHNPLIAKLSSNGDLIWAKVPGYNETNCFHVFSSAIDHENNILISGNFYQGNGIFPDTIIPDTPNKTTWFIAKYNTNGNFQWVQTWISNHLFQFTIDMSNNVLVVITDSIRKFSAVGDLLWEKKINVYLPNTDFWPKLTVDSLNNFYLAASYSDTLIVGDDTFISKGYNDIICLKYNPSGNPVWGISAGGPRNDSPHSIFIKKNRIIITGTFMDKIFFNDDSLAFSTMWKSNSFITEYDLAGNLKFAKKVGGKYGCSSNLVSISKSIYLSGYGHDSTYFDNFCLTGSQYYYLSRLQSEILWEIEYPETFKIYPNPTQSTLTVNFNPVYKNVSFEIYDLQGKLIMRDDLNNYSNCINIGFLSKGLYLLKLKMDDNMICRKIEKL